MLTPAQIRLLGAKGLDAFDIADVIEAGAKQVDDAAERRKVLDRDRKAKKRAEEKSARTDADERPCTRANTSGIVRADCPADKADNSLPLPSPKENNQTPSPTPPRPSLRSGSSRANAAFDRFREVYPKRDGSQSWEKTRLAMVKIVDKLGIDPEPILEVAEGLGEYFRYVEKRSFIPMPVTWLNQKRWLDDYSEPILPSNKSFSSMLRNHVNEQREQQNQPTGAALLGYQ